MKSSEIQLHLERLESEERLHRLRLDTMIPAIRQELLQPSHIWMKEHLQKQVDSNPASVIGLGTEKLGKLKSDFRSLLESLPSIIENTTADTAKWPHKVAIIPTSAEDFHSIFRDIVCHLGLLLKEYGLVYIAGDFQVWQTYHPDEKLRVSNGVTLSPLTPTMLSYIKTGKELREIQRQLDITKKQIQAAKAKELWESA